MRRSATCLLQSNLSRSKTTMEKRMRMELKHVLKVPLKHDEAAIYNDDDEDENDLLNT